MAGVRGAPILVTGSPRSGTTITGRLLALPRSAGYVHEPFNPRVGLAENELDFPFVAAGDPDPRYEWLVADLLAGRAAFRRRRPRLRYLGASWSPLVRRLVIKDPHACLLTEWLHRRLGWQAVIVVRHPAAVVASHRRLGWPFGVHSLLAQPELRDGPLRGLTAAAGGRELEPLDAWSYLWLGCYSLLAEFAARNPALLLVRHEDLFADPVAAFRELYGRFELPWSRRAERRVARAGRESGPLLIRWRKDLGAGELARIAAIARPLADRFYGEESWRPTG